MSLSKIHSANAFLSTVAWLYHIYRILICVCRLEWLLSDAIMRFLHVWLPTLPSSSLLHYIDKRSSLTVTNYRVVSHSAAYNRHEVLSFNKNETDVVILNSWSNQLIMNSKETDGWHMAVNGRGTEVYKIMPQNSRTSCHEYCACCWHQARFLRCTRKT